MSTFFKAFQGKAMGKQLFQGCSPLFFALINAQPLKNIGFCIVSLVGQVIFKLKMIKAVAAPYGDVAFMPTGGINAENVRSYLAYDRIVACGGSWMVKKDMIAAGEFDKITEMVREAAQVVREVRG